jgi:hypothetical protein
MAACPGEADPDMLLQLLRARNRRSPASGPAPGGEAVLPAAVGAARATPRREGAATPLRWTPARLTAAQTLWGEGFLGPPGAAEVQHLAAPLGLDGSRSVLLLAESAGGPGATLAAGFGARVAAFEADPALAKAALAHVQERKLTERVTVQGWNPQSPALPHGAAHHALALEPLARMASAEVGAAVLFAGIAGALHRGGQMVLMELVRTPGPPDAGLLAWQESAGRRRSPARAASIEAAIAASGFDLRIAEDITERHVQAALRGWRELAARLRSARPGNAALATLVGEAEQWLLRVRLLQSGQLRLMRWHAVVAPAG